MQPGAEHIVAFDVGTNGAKAVLVDAKGRILGKAFRPYPVLYPRPGWAEQNAEDWWDAVAETTRQVLDQSGVPSSSVAGMTFSSQLLGLVPMSADGEVLRRPIIWLDERATVEARSFMRHFGGPELFRLIAGAKISGKDGIPKLAWIKRHEPEVYRRMACFLDVGGYLLWRATGRMVMDWSGASAYGFDLKKKRWMAGLISYAGIDPSKLPPLVRSTDVVGPLTPEAADACGLVPGTPVVAGCGDAQSAAVGAGIVHSGEGHLCLGTSGWVNVLLDRRPRGKHGAVVIQSADPRRNLLFSEMETAGACVQWIAEELYDAAGDRSGVFRRMDADVATVEPGSGALLFTPWMYGERAPIPDPNVRGAFLNLGLDHGREHLVRAVFEGVCYQFRWIVEFLERDFGVHLPVLRIMGGGAKSDVWMQILADVSKRRVETVHDPQDAGAVGAALTGAVGLGMYPDFESLGLVVEPAAVFEPHPEAAATYQPLFETYTRAHRALRRLYRELNAARTHEG